MLVTYMVSKGKELLLIYMAVNTLCVFVNLVVQPCILKRNLHVSKLFYVLLLISLSGPLYF